MPIKTIDGQNVFVCVCGEYWFELVGDIFVCKCGRKYFRNYQIIGRTIARHLLRVQNCSQIGGSKPLTNSII